MAPASKPSSNRSTLPATKNSIPGDKSALTPCGIRIGAPAMTSRGMGEEDFKRIAGYIDTAITLCKTVQAGLPKEANKLKDFKAKVASESVGRYYSVEEGDCGLGLGTFPLPV